MSSYKNKKDFTIHTRTANKLMTPQGEVMNLRVRFCTAQIRCAISRYLPYCDCIFLETVLLRRNLTQIRGIEGKEAVKRRFKSLSLQQNHAVGHSESQEKESRWWLLHRLTPPHHHSFSSASEMARTAIYQPQKFVSHSFISFLRCFLLNNFVLAYY